MPNEEVSGRIRARSGFRRGRQGFIPAGSQDSSVPAILNWPDPSRPPGTPGNEGLDPAGPGRTEARIGVRTAAQRDLLEPGERERREGPESPPLEWFPS